MVKMDVRRCIFLACIILFAFTGCRKKEKPLNVVLFLVDDLGWRDVGCYGSTFYETPHVDRLAQQGLRFTNAYAACHVCSPTRASILTGKNPARINLTDWLPGRKDFDFQKLKNVPINQYLPFDEETIAERLQAEGYQTAIFGKWHLGEDPSGPLSHGFDLQVPDWNKGWPLSYYHPFELEGLQGEQGDYLTDVLTTEALSFIEDNKEKPFFLYLSHFAVHDPIQGPKGLIDKYDEKRLEMSYSGPAFTLEGNPDNSIVFSQQEKDSLMHLAAYDGYSVLPHNMVKIKQHQDNVQFAGMVESMDASLGRVMEKLEALGLEENTIIIFYSDNGGMSSANFYNPDRTIPASKLDKAFSTSNVPLRGAKGWLYEGGIRVPLIIKWPGTKVEGTTCEVPVNSPDLYPTILDMLGLPLSPGQHADGISLTPLFNKNQDLDREALYWHFPHYSNHGMQSPGGAIRMGPYKLIEYFENHTVQLYDLENDIAEAHDLSQEHPDKVKELQAKLKSWRESLNARMMEENPAYDAER
jgi:arylsulfatase A